MTVRGFSIDWEGRGHTPVGPPPVAAARFARPDGLLFLGDGAGLRAGDLAPVGGKAQVVYLDPPYNRGGRFDGYDDNLPRHRWLGAMEQMLDTCRELLDVTGTLWLHLDDTEAHRGRCLLDEVFGCRAFIADLTVESNPKGRQFDRHFAGSHDRLMVYAREPSVTRLRSGSSDAVDPSDFPHRGPDGIRYRLLPLRNTNKRFSPRTTPTMSFPLFGDPDSGVVSVDPAPGLVEILPVFGDLSQAVWRWAPQRVRERADELVCRTVQGKLGERVDVYQVDRNYPGRVKKLRTIWPSSEVGSTDTARGELRALGVRGFQTPKPSALLRRIIELSTDPGDLVLDTFAGSGTTAAVAAELGRRWAVVERNPDTVRDVLLPRLHAVGLTAVEVGGAHPGGAEPAGPRGQMSSLGEDPHDVTDHVPRSFPKGSAG